MRKKLIGLLCLYLIMSVVFVQMTPVFATEPIETVRVYTGDEALTGAEGGYDFFRSRTKRVNVALNTSLNSQTELLNVLESKAGSILNGWKLWSLYSSGDDISGDAPILTYIAPNGTLSEDNIAAAEQSRSASALLEPLLTPKYEISHQPTSDEPYISIRDVQEDEDITESDDLSFAWYKAVKTEIPVVDTESAAPGKITVSYNDLCHYDGSGGGAGIWIPFYDDEYEVYVIEVGLYASAGDVIKFKPVSVNAADLRSFSSHEFVYRDGAFIYTAIGEEDGYYLCFESDTNFTGEITVERDGVSDTPVAGQTAFTFSGGGSDSYLCKASIKDDNFPNKVCVLTSDMFTPEEIDVTFDDKTETYTGSPISHTISESITGVQSIAYNYVGGDYNSADAPVNAGTYTVTATFTMADGQPQISPASATLTIEQKPIMAVWTDLVFDYDGGTKSPSVSLVGVVGNDDCTPSVSGASVCGIHNVMLSLTGDEKDNYSVTNPMSSITIRETPVVFTVTDNVKKYDGGELVPAIEVSPDTSYAVTYKCDGVTVDSITNVGSYEIWASIDSYNYRHAGFTDNLSRKIGVATIYKNKAPATYKATFSAGTGAAGDAPSDISGLLSGAIVVLPKAEGFSKAGYSFAGWKLDNAVYQPGDTYTVANKNVSFTAVWNNNGATINGVVDKSGTPLSNATVTLMLGNSVIAETVTNDEGEYEFTNLAAGIYNLVATHNGITVTVMVEITNDSENESNITLPAGRTNSLLSIVPGSVTAVVGNLNEIFSNPNVYTDDDKELVDNGGTVEISMTVNVTVLNGENEQKIRQAAGKNNVGLVLDLYITELFYPEGWKIGDPLRGMDISDSGTLLDILVHLPADLQGKDSYTIYRLHDGRVDTLTTTPNAAGEYIEVNDSKTAITIHARYFSEYVIAWKDVVRTVGGNYSGSTLYTVKFETNGGSEISNKTVSEDSLLKGLAVPVKDGYTFDGWFTDKELSKAYDFSKGVTADFTLYAKWTENKDGTDITDTPDKWVNRFTDVHENDWFYNAVAYVSEKGLFSGVEDTLFAPDAPITRAMLVTVLWRNEGKPAADAATAFTDVDESAYYYEAVRWAASVGIVKGYSETEFAPDQNIIREQIAAIMHRYAQYKGYDVSVGANTNILSYEDFESISEWAIPDIQYAVGAGLMSGKTDSTINPTDNATRAEFAKILQSFLEIQAPLPSEK